MAYESAFEPRLELAGGGVWLDGTLEVSVTDPMGRTPITVIAMEDEFKVLVKAVLEGEGVDYLGGEWVMNLFLERFGPEEDLIIVTEDTRTITPGTSVYDWEYNRDPISDRIVPGAYRLIAVLTSRKPNGLPGSLAAYCEGPILQFHEAHTP